MSANSHSRFNFQLPKSPAGSQPFDFGNPEGRNDLSSQTSFRLHILGKRNWDSSQVDEEVAEKLVRKAFDVEHNTKVIIKSLADHPVRRAVVATLSFSQIPTKISQTSGLVHEFEESLQGLSVSLDTHFRGFTPLHSRTSSRYDCDFVALSGLGGHAFGSFKCRGGEYMWLRDDLPFSVPNARSFIYGYDTELYGSTSFQSLEDLGLAFKDALKSVFREDFGSGTLNPLIFLGHSLGGLILKEALCQMSTNPRVNDRLLLKSIRAILFFGTPNQGIDIRSLVPIVEEQANEDFLRSLGTDSVELRRQAQQWSKAFDSSQSDLISNNLEIISYYETSTSPTAVKVGGSWKMSGPSARLVDRSSATHGRPWENERRFVQPIGRDHSDLVKFRTRNDPVYVNHVLPRLQSYQRPHMHTADEQQTEQLERLQKENRDLKAVVTSLRGALQKEKRKTEDFHNMDIRAVGQTGDAPSDTQIQSRFEQLRDEICQLVKKHFTKNTEKLSPKASLNAPELLNRAKVATLLYDSFFGRQCCIFGVGIQMDKGLARFEQELLYGKGADVEVNDILEWRARTVHICQSMKIASKHDYVKEAVARIWSQMALSCQSQLTPSERSLVLKDFEALCASALNLAILLRSTKSEFEWQQKPQGLVPKRDEVEILGTLGPDIKKDEKYVADRVVFGGLVRGDAKTGRFKDGLIRLLRPSVLIA